LPRPEGIETSLVRRDMHDCVLALRGAVTRWSSAAVVGALSKPLLHAQQVLVDVSGLQVGWTPGLRAFPSALTRAGGWPWARLVLFGAGDHLAARLGALRVSETVPVAVDVDAAYELAGVRPPVVVRGHELTADLTSVARARALVRDACAVWGVDDADDDAALVANELVTNAVEHAGTGCRLKLVLDGRGLTVSVRDGRRGGLEALPPLDVTGDRGRGLLVVAGVSRTWGVVEHADGKTVWALLPLAAR
jgi:anti-sigma regulatory factor (Ser/Thr protein kinase)